MQVFYSVMKNDISCRIFVTGVISGALLYIKDDFEEVGNSYFLQVQSFLFFFNIEFRNWFAVVMWFAARKK